MPIRPKASLDVHVHYGWSHLSQEERSGGSGTSEGERAGDGTSTVVDGGGGGGSGGATGGTVDFISW